jgi:hypothetical protein
LALGPSEAQPTEQTAQELVEQRVDRGQEPSDGSVERVRVEQPGHRAQQVAQQVAGARLGHDVEVDLAEIDDQAEQVDLGRAELQVEDVATVRRRPSHARATRAHALDGVDGDRNVLLECPVHLGRGPVPLRDGLHQDIGDELPLDELELHRGGSGLHPSAVLVDIADHRGLEQVLPGGDDRRPFSSVPGGAGAGRHRDGHRQHHERGDRCCERTPSCLPETRHD